MPGFPMYSEYGKMPQVVQKMVYVAVLPQVATERLRELHDGGVIRLRHHRALALADRTIAAHAT